MTRDEAIEAAAEWLRSTHWDGKGCGTDGAGGCSRCYGPSPADAREVAEEVAAALVPVLLNDLADRIEFVGAGDENVAWSKGMLSAVLLVRAAAEGWGA